MAVADPGGTRPTTGPLTSGSWDPKKTTGPIPAQQSVSDQWASAAQAIGMPYYYEEQALPYYENSLDAMQVNPGGSYGMEKPPEGYTWGDVMSLYSSIDQFVASAGGRYMPTSGQVNQMLSMGLSNQPASAVFRYLSDAAGVSSKLPWAATGMSATQYESSLANLQSTIGEYTGDPAMYSELASEALQKYGNNGGADAWLKSQLTTNTKYTQNAKTPWLQYGKSYQQWQDIKKQDSSLMFAQAGKNATEAQLATAYGNIQAAPKQPLAAGVGVKDAAPALNALGGGSTGQAGRSNVR